YINITNCNGPRPEAPRAASPRGSSAGAGPRDDADRGGPGDPRRAEQEHQPVLSVADRERHASSSLARIAAAAREILQDASGLSGERSAGISDRAQLGNDAGRERARSLAARGC